ncbi:MAG: citrate synthase [Myxococcales bacterium]|nr:MAG: citrate synthase [Myxococcales bacterium]
MNYFDKLGAVAKANNEIEGKYYHMYHVKRGLRNADGSGVLVGLTTVSSVLGYEKIDEDIIPVHGKLVYRGIDLRDIVAGFERENRFGFEETAYLLLTGNLPTADELHQFNEMLGAMRLLNKNFHRDVLETFRTRDIMNSLARSVLTLYSMDERADNLDVYNQIRQGIGLIAKLATLAPYAYYVIRHGFYDESLIIHRPQIELSTAENLLHLLRADSKYSELEAKTLDICLVLHADHGGGNNSTFTTRVVSSTNTDFYSAVSSALGSLKGPLHGGANNRVVAMMDHLKANLKDPTNIEEVRNYLFKILRGEAYDGAGKLYGIGHAVYTLSDPRAEILRGYARKLAWEKGREEEYRLYEIVEQEGPKALREYKNDPNLSVSSNVDFYSGFVYDCLNIPREVFTPLFAVARVAGWAAHRVEMMSNAEKIIRPAFKSLARTQKYTPLVGRESGGSVPVAERAAEDLG